MVSLLSQSVPLPSPGSVMMAAKSAPRMAARTGTKRICPRVSRAYTESPAPRGKDIHVFPISRALAERRVVVAGGGAVAERTVHALLAAGARVTVIGPALTHRLAQWAEAGEIAWTARL